MPPVDIAKEYVPSALESLLTATLVNTVSAVNVISIAEKGGAPVVDVAHRPTSRLELKDFITVNVRSKVPV
jgi:hypothetical protein